MVNIIRLKELIIEKGLSNADVAKALKITEHALEERYNKAVFGADEIHKLVKLLDISSPEEVFFVDSGA